MSNGLLRYASFDIQETPDISTTESTMTTNKIALNLEDQGEVDGFMRAASEALRHLGKSNYPICSRRMIVDNIKHKRLNQPEHLSVSL